MGSFVTWFVAVVALLPSVVEAQPGTRRATTLPALSTHPFFFHGYEVVVRGDLVGEGVLAYLVDGDTRLLTLDLTPPPAGSVERLEIIGTFYDVGRFKSDDPRVVDLPFSRLSESLLNKPWPGVGELPVLLATSARAAAETESATLRGLALEPTPYVGQDVTVTGRFRGRNLYGDLPTAPGQGRHDFVLVSADAAVWVVGLEPKGDDFELDVQARLDTGRWLTVTGAVKLENGMVLIEGSELAIADPPSRPDPAPVPVETRRGPAPEVIFSTPLQDDIDVPADSTVRIQFSRDMEPTSFTGQVKVAYPPSAAATQPAPTTPVTDFDVEYNGRNRVLMIRFTNLLERYRTVTVELLDGITATDGVPIAPWSLSFFTGG